MKVYSFLKIAVLGAVTSLALVTGCKYDVTAPLWDQPYTAPPTPEITSIIPAQRAMAGVNTITIQGRNLGGVPDAYGVYFGNAPAEITQKSATAITVRRPTLVTDSCTVKLVSDSALVVAKSPSTYAIDPVVGRSQAFLDNVQLSALAVDNAENLYVVITASREIVRLTPTGVKSVLGTATRAPTDASFGPDGRLYMTGNNREISVVNMSTGAVARWIQLPAGKVVKFGDFDANGYFYTGGVRTDLVIVAPNLTTTNSGFYLTAEILGVRVFGGYVYVTAKNPVGQSPSVGIWRHSISAGGVLGTKELVLDWDGVGEFASRTITGISRSINGTLYIGTDSENPLLFRDPTAGSLDYFYKGIVVPYCKQFCWGRGSYIYMINGNTAAGQDWIVIRIDMGTTSASR